MNIKNADAGTYRLRDGILQDDGATLSFLFDAGEGKEKTSAQIVVWQGMELYFKILSSTSTESGSVSDTLGNGWWRIPLSSAPSFFVSPEPGLLRLQTEAVKVLSDQGKETLDGRSYRHVTVSLDEAKAVSLLRRVATDRETTFDEQMVLSQLRATGATGDLWIDTKTFLTSKMTWTTKAGLTFTFAVSDPDDTPPVLPPAGARTLPDNVPLSAVIQLFFPDGSVTLPINSFFSSPRSYE
jgi:hypothetical protein